MFVRNVDNLGATADPAVLGHHIRSGRQTTCELAPKRAGDVGGADDDLQMVMWDFDDLMLVLFDFYGSLNSDGRISSLTFNEWTMFYQDFNLHEGSTSKAAARSRGGRHSGRFFPCCTSPHDGTLQGVSFRGCP